MHDTGREMEESHDGTKKNYLRITYFNKAFIMKLLMTIELQRKLLTDKSMLASGLFGSRAFLSMFHVQSVDL